MTTYTITYSNHDTGATDGQMIREGFDRAIRSAQLMSECGYKTVTVTANA